MLQPTDRGREVLPPLPPNRACGFPAHGFPVGSFYIETSTSDFFLFGDFLAPRYRICSQTHCLFTNFDCL